MEYLKGKNSILTVHYVKYSYTAGRYFIMPLDAKVYTHIDFRDILFFTLLSHFIYNIVL